MPFSETIEQDKKWDEPPDQFEIEMAGNNQKVVEHGSRSKKLIMAAVLVLLFVVILVVIIIASSGDDEEIGEGVEADSTDVELN